MMPKSRFWGAIQSWEVILPLFSKINFIISRDPLIKSSLRAGGRGMEDSSLASSIEKGGDKNPIDLPKEEHEMVVLIMTTQRSDFFQCMHAAEC